MAVTYTYTQTTTNGDENAILLTVTNGSGAAWGSYFIAADYTYVDSTATPATTTHYFTEGTGTALGAGSSLSVTLPISTATFSTALATNLLVGVSFPATVTAV